ncbi:pyridoxal-dependent decarboxylase [Nonomuraea rosea]|uniref:Pyridoxal-dependent decarboxylase n=1 Tax=Nonomuraea rosea TaxID=638574 RepID=A0ABP6ZEF9_9ACTN
MSFTPDVAGHHSDTSGPILDAARRATAYLEARTQRGIFPAEEALSDLAAFPRDLADEPLPASEVLTMLDELGSPATVVTTAGRYFGYVNGGTDPAAAAAAVLTGVWDQNIALPDMSPIAGLLDDLAARWTLDLLGLPCTAIASFCSGASIANLTCILAARDALLHHNGWNVDRRGLTGAPPLRVIASAEMHASVAKALRAAGLGADDVIAAPTDELGRVRAEDFPDADERTLVLLQAGNVNTGHSDPFADIIPAIRERGGWVHVDGAFGLWAAASPMHRHLVNGVEQADSWATDAHKWLNAPYDSGIAICRVPGDLRRAMAFNAAYLSTDAERAPAHLGLQMSQRARGAEVWAILAHRGRAGVASLVDRLCAHAQHMAHLLQAAGVRLLVPVGLNQVLVQFDDDATTDAVIAAVQQDRTCWAAGTSWHGSRAMRISICDTATTSADIDTCAEAILRCWHACRAL